MQRIKQALEKVKLTINTSKSERYPMHSLKNCEMEILGYTLIYTSTQRRFKININTMIILNAGWRLIGDRNHLNF